ncbi:MAG: DUF2202 domain-containing protein [Demequinaceae bacterium]|nr:DUF2202 domain-containing protein [Demequinaceae bacterium]
MNKKLIASIALGGAALFAVPAGIAYAVASGDDARPGAFTAFGSHGMQDGRDTASRSGARSGEQSGAGMMQGGMHGSSMGNQAMAGGGVHAQGTVGDPADLVEEGSTATASEAASLEYMVEEEKLAHDLYVELGDAWGLRIFTNIASAETQHEDAVKALLDAYGLDDPTAGAAVGEFSDPALQSLYDTLLAQGLASQTAALEVGAIVEETDIADLRDRASDSPAIDQVFGQLEAGSENHLRAFIINLDRLGVTYEAQVLSSSDVASITGQ